jgi:hypothetical protein
MEIWGIAQAEYGSGILEQLLSEGWEPFACTIERKVAIIWLKKKTSV